MPTLTPGAQASRSAQQMGRTPIEPMSEHSKSTLKPTGKSLTSPHRPSTRLGPQEKDQFTREASGGSIVAKFIPRPPSTKRHASDGLSPVNTETHHFTVEAGGTIRDSQGKAVSPNTPTNPQKEQIQRSPLNRELKTPVRENEQTSERVSPKGERYTHFHNFDWTPGAEDEPSIEPGISPTGERYTHFDDFDWTRERADDPAKGGQR